MRRSTTSLSRACYGLWLCLGALTSVQAHPYPQPADNTINTPATNASIALEQLLNRAATASGAGYAPRSVTCPSDFTFIREASTVSGSESSYISARKTQTSQALLTFLHNVGITDADKYFSNSSLAPTTAIAFSGGGFRAMLNAGSVFRGFDSRAGLAGPLSGVLQGMDYMAGLSGGGWFVGGVAINDFATVDDLNANMWHLQDNLVAPGGIIDTIKYLTGIQSQVSEKKDAGFETTITDYWGLAVGRHTVNPTDGGPNTLWSGIPSLSSFQSSEMPFPIVVADGRRMGELIEEVNATIYEINPFEFGSWDTGASYFYPTRYLGTSMSGGQPVDSNNCITEFDVAAFVLGTTSSLFNSIFTTLVDSIPDGVFGDILKAILNDILEGIAATGEDIAYYPNPFKSYMPAANSVSSYDFLSLVDGGTDNENLPLWPLIQPDRGVDFILATDSSADINNYPNGASMAATFHRLQANDSYSQANIPFPFVPGQDTFVNLGLNKRPTFFGCNAKNYTDQGLLVPPMIVYMANAPWSYYTNTSTFQLSYAAGEVAGFLANGIEQVTQGGDEDWPTCLGCAIVQRSKDRAGDEVGDQCQQCMQKYCWDGSLAEQASTYEPTLLNGSDWTYAQQQEVVDQETKSQDDELGSVLQDLLEASA